MSIETFNYRAIRFFRGRKNDTPFLIRDSAPSPSFYAMIDKNQFGVYFLGKTILRELDYSFKDRTQWIIEVPKDTIVVGLGERGGDLNRWGRKFRITNEDPFFYYGNPYRDPLYISVPYLVVVGEGFALGILFNNPYRGIIDLRKRGIIRFIFDGGGIDVVLFLGHDIKDVQREFARVVGTQFLPPTWALGYHQSKWSYRSAREVLDLIEKFEKYRILLSAVYLDLEYMYNKHVFTWDKKKFPDPKGLISKLREKGIHLVPIIDPFVVDSEYGIARTGKRRGYFIKDYKGKYLRISGWGGKSLLVNMYDDKARRWWAKLYSKFSEIYNLDGFWNDMNEPSSVAFPLLSRTELRNGRVRFESRNISLISVKGVYAVQENKAVYEEFEKKNKRIFILSRSGNIGIQRYAAVWTGDNWSSWLHLAESIRILLSLSLCGIQFCGADIGGFMPPLFKSSEELYIRWIQLGTFYPLMRAHSCTMRIPNEPWRFGERALSIARRFIELRYRLLPYIYTQFYFAHYYGDPIIRPLFYEYPKDPAAYRFQYEFMFGDSILVAPILYPKPKKWSVYLPNGKWVDFWTNEVVNGSRIIAVKPTLEIIPVYIKYGSIIPMRTRFNNNYEPLNEEIELKIYGETAKGYLYIDDGATLDYQNGKYMLYTIFAKKNKITIIDKNGKIKTISPNKEGNVIINTEFLAN